MVITNSGIIFWQYACTFNISNLSQRNVTIFGDPKIDGAICFAHPVHPFLCRRSQCSTMMLLCSFFWTAAISVERWSCSTNVHVSTVAPCPCSVSALRLYTCQPFLYILDAPFHVHFSEKSIKSHYRKQWRSRTFGRPGLWSYLPSLSF